MPETPWVAVTFETCRDVAGPFYHGTKAELPIGARLEPGHPSNYEPGRALAHVYFSANLEPAIWGAELAVAFADGPARGHVYVVEPVGPFEDDPNLTNKRFPGNPTRSYRSREALRVVGVVEVWTPHPPEAVEAMLASLAALRARGAALIED